MSEDLSDAEHPSSLAEPRPKVLPDVLGGVDSETVDGVGLNELLDPVLVRGHNRRVLGVDVHEGEFGVAEPATCTEMSSVWISLSAKKLEDGGKGSRREAKEKGKTHHCSAEVALE
jgi:hypothetical protein